MPTYYDTIIRCPACIAEGRSGGEPSQWYHGECDGKLQIGDNAMERCVECGRSSHIKNWRYACEEHETDYKPTTNAHFANAISTSGQLASIAGRVWLITLLENLGDDW